MLSTLQHVLVRSSRSRLAPAANLCRTISTNNATKSEASDTKLSQQNRHVGSAAPVHPAYEPPLAGNIYKLILDPETTMADSRSRHLVSSADDCVNDYRALAEMPIWQGLMAAALEKGEVRVLDACCGTGRWAQAFSERVVQGSQNVSCDFADLCGDSLKELEYRLEAINNLSGKNVFRGDICELSHLGAAALSYDIVVNMHGLYGIPKSKLSQAVQAMYDTLKPGGTMIIAIGSDSSPYQQVPEESLGRPVCGAADIVQACRELGIQAGVSTITYSEHFERTDMAGLHHFLLNECGGNCFSVDVATDMQCPTATIQKYADNHFDSAFGQYRFRQEATIITIIRDPTLRPGMPSFGDFYAEHKWILDPDSMADCTTTMADSRSQHVVSCADDCVNDYRALSEMPIWEGLMAASFNREVRVLDACCGTGRWAQAFSERVVQGSQNVSCDFADLCGDSLKELGYRLKGINNLVGKRVFEGDICELSNLGVPALSYDIVVNMHGLYGIPKSMLPQAVQAMYDALKPGGSMIMAIGSDSSPYQQIPVESLGSPVCGAADIVQACRDLGIQASVSKITYSEQFERTDKKGLHHFLHNESGGNCFSVDAATDMKSSTEAIAKYADKHFDSVFGQYRFPQETTIIIVSRNA